jgi:hypothetical protein
MTGRHMLMAAGLAVAAWLAVFGDKKPAADIAEPIARASAPVGIATAPAVSREGQAGRDTNSGKGKSDLVILALLPRETLIGAGDVGNPARNDRLFANQSWTPPPPLPPPPVAPPPPAAPPLPFTYLGKKVEDSIWEAYLARGDQTFIVREQTVIEGTYRVDSIKPPTLSLTYLPLNQVQTVTIGGTD